MFQHLKKKQKIGQTLQYSHLILKKINENAETDLKIIIPNTSQGSST
jgi:hypothetical protein